MTKKFRQTINTLLASAIALLGYGCGQKKYVVDKTVIDANGATEIHEEIRLMYGPPQYFNKEQTDSARLEPQAISTEEIVRDIIKKDSANQDTLVVEEPKPKVEPQHPPIMVKYGIPPIMKTR